MILTDFSGFGCFLKGKFYLRNFHGNYRFITNEDAEGVEAGIISLWFVTVPEESVSYSQ